MRIPWQCVACGERGTTSRLLTYPQGKLARCPACGLCWNVEPPSADVLGSLYQTGFYGGRTPRAGAVAALLHRVNNAVRLRELRGMSAGKLLDVGCGKGRFLAAAREAGWDVRGVEFAPHLAAEARDRYGVDVRAGDFLEVPLETPFDVVTMWHVLEHLPRPADAVARSWELLRPGGRLVVSVPNIESVQAVLSGASWFHLDLPRHLFHFTPRSLRRLVERHGFRVEWIGHFYPEMEIIGLIQSALNALGLEPDRFYLYLKRDPTARLDRVVAISAALATAMLPGAAAWALLAPVVRSGASIQVAARRC